MLDINPKFSSPTQMNGKHTTTVNSAETHFDIMIHISSVSAVLVTDYGKYGFDSLQGHVYL
jgi:hypothetical protein